MFGIHLPNCPFCWCLVDVPYELDTSIPRCRRWRWRGSSSCPTGGIIQWHWPRSLVRNGVWKWMAQFCDNLGYGMPRHFFSTGTSSASEPPNQLPSERPWVKIDQNHFSPPTAPNPHNLACHFLEHPQRYVLWYPFLCHGFLLCKAMSWCTLPHFVLYRSFRLLGASGRTGKWQDLDWRGGEGLGIRMIEPPIAMMISLSVVQWRRKRRKEVLYLQIILVCSFSFSGDISAFSVAYLCNCNNAVLSQPAFLIIFGWCFPSQIPVAFLVCGSLPPKAFVNHQRLISNGRWKLLPDPFSTLTSQKKGINKSFHPQNEAYIVS